IGVPEILHPFLFNPEFVLYLKKPGLSPRLVGVWTFWGRHPVDRSGSQMDDHDAFELHSKLAPAVNYARHRKPYVLSEPRITLEVLHSPNPRYLKEPKK